MVRQRSSGVASRNVKLSIETYNRLDRYLLDLMTQRGERKLTLNDAVATLLDKHYRSQEKTSGKE